MQNNVFISNPNLFCAFFSPVVTTIFRVGGKLVFLLCGLLGSLMGGESRAQEPLTLKQALGMALQHSPDARKARSELQSQVERRRGAWSGLGPRVDLQYRDVYYRDKLEMEMGPATVVMRDDRSTVGSVVVTQPVIGLYGLYELAQFEGVTEEARELGLEMTEREVAYQTAETYLRAQSAGMLYGVAEASLQAADAQVKDGESLVNVGRINQGDYLRLQVAQSEAQARLAEAEAFRDVMFSTLIELTGQGAAQAKAGAPPVSLEADSPFAGLETAVPPPSQDEAMRAALESNPEYRLAVTGKDLVSFNRKLAYTEFLPSVNFFAQWDRDFRPLNSNPENTQSYGVSVNWNLWSSGNSIFGVRESTQQIMAAEAGIGSAEQRLRLGIYQHVANLKAQELSMRLARTTVDQASEAYRIEKAKFSSGSSSASDLVLAEASLTAARGRVITSHADYQVTRLQLNKAMGKDLDSLLR